MICKFSRQNKNCNIFRILAQIYNKRHYREQMTVDSERNGVFENYIFLEADGEDKKKEMVKKHQ